MEKHASKTNQRRHRRYRISGTVTVRPIEPFKGLIHGISEGGISAFIAEPELKSGDMVEVRLPLAGGDMFAVAVVRHHTGAQFGFEFVGLTAEQVEQIRDSEKHLQPLISAVAKPTRRSR